MIRKFNINYYVYFFFIIYFLLGLFIFKDYGIGIEEHFQRQNGFYWLNHFLSFTNFEDLKSIANSKYQFILSTDPDLPDANFFNFYGIIFDLPLALIETFFQIETTKVYFDLRHLFTFIIFFISSIYFFNIIKNRFPNNFIIFIGLFFYIATPRIFGDSFHNNKDILFLSILTISISYLFDFFEKNNIKNLILFSFFAALATSSRIMGIYLPLMLIIFIYIDFLSSKVNFKFFINQTIKLFFLYIFFLYLHYPYVWQLNIFDFFSWFKNFFYWMDLKILYGGEYYSIKYLPRSYLPLWIFISTPIIVTILSLMGCLTLLKRFFVRIINIKENLIKSNDLWNSTNEKKDVFILLSFISFFSYAIFLNVAMLSGWRHFYFLHIFLIYFATFGVYCLKIYLQKKINLIFFYIFFITVGFFIAFENYNFHPYQSIYFNNFLSQSQTKNFQGDSASLSRSDALKFILSEEKNNDKIIYVANSSWTPMYNGKDALTDEEKSRIIFVGQEFEKADYIYTNYIYKSGDKYKKNYKIPITFKKIKDFQIENILIYSVYKKGNK